MLQHDRHWLVSKLRMGLQKAIKAPEPASLRLVSEPSGAHKSNMVAHHIPKDATEGWELAKRFERLIRIGREQRL